MAETDTQAAIAQLAARRSHNPKVVSSILTGRISLAQMAAQRLWLCILKRVFVQRSFWFLISMSLLLLVEVYYFLCRKLRNGCFVCIFEGLYF